MKNRYVVVLLDNKLTDVDAIQAAHEVAKVAEKVVELRVCGTRELIGNIEPDGGVYLRRESNPPKSKKDSTHNE